MNDNLADAHILHHRETDPAGSDFRRRRYCEEREVIIRKNGSAKVMMTIGGVAITILLTLVAFLGGRDRVRVDNDITRIDSVQTQHTAQLAATSQAVAVLTAGQSQAAEDRKELKQNQKELMEAINRVYTELRKKP